jgi:hypothetical protein
MSLNYFLGSKKGWKKAFADVPKAENFSLEKAVSLMSIFVVKEAFI